MGKTNSRWSHSLTSFTQALSPAYISAFCNMRTGSHTNQGPKAEGKRLVKVRKKTWITPNSALRVKKELYIPPQGAQKAGGSFYFSDLD